MNARVIVMRYRLSPQASSALFFQYNTQLGPPFHILVDTNFVNFSVKYKLDIIKNMMDCLYAKCKWSENEAAPVFGCKI